MGGFFLRAPFGFSISTMRKNSRQAFRLARKSVGGGASIAAARAEAVFVARRFVERQRRIRARAGEGAEATIFDPAPLVGDGEFDLAMTELFGGFAPAFYDGYRAARAIDDGYAQRRTAYQLFHILNHYNLFGDGYLRAAESMIADLARAA